jgi:hypothetical protein
VLARSTAASANPSMVRGCASMDCIIARIAARLAIYISPTPMTTDRVRIECALQDDSRLLAAVAVIVSHTARNAGVPESAQEKLAAAAVEACRKAFASVSTKKGDDSAIGLIADQFPDRVEIIVESAGKNLAESELHKAVSGAGNDGSRLSGADRVQHEADEGRSRTRFIKYCDALDSKRVE